MIDPNQLRAQLRACAPGMPGWQAFENACIAILTYLFTPPLSRPHIQPRTFSGIDRRDAIFPNRNHEGAGNWPHLYKELDARMVLFEFKNYDTTEIGKDEVNQTRNYLTAPMGRLAVLCTNKKPNEAAHIKRNTIFSEEKKVILFIGPDELIEMMSIKERGEDPSNLILDLVELFYIQHE
ncbi:hypothetical protein [Methylobacterium tarhaniae]|uniref:hypothetical protein n=1 Tax=Methylobacterium tarhaniae TaxID=1187852 RepID=UPI003CFEC7E9